MDPPIEPQVKREQPDPVNLAPVSFNPINRLPNAEDVPPAASASGISTGGPNAETATNPLEILSKEPPKAPQKMKSPPLLASSSEPARKASAATQLIEALEDLSEPEMTVGTEISEAAESPSRGSTQRHTETLPKMTSETSSDIRISNGIDKRSDVPSGNGQKQPQSTQSTNVNVNSNDTTDAELSKPYSLDNPNSFLVYLDSVYKIEEDIHWKNYLVHFEQKLDKKYHRLARRAKRHRHVKNQKKSSTSVAPTGSAPSNGASRANSGNSGAGSGDISHISVNSSSKNSNSVLSSAKTASARQPQKQSKSDKSRITSPKSARGPRSASEEESGREMQDVYASDTTDNYSEPESEQESEPEYRPSRRNRKRRSRNRKSSKSGKRSRSSSQKPVSGESGDDGRIKKTRSRFIHGEDSTVAAAVRQLKLQMAQQNPEVPVVLLDETEAEWRRGSGSDSSDGAETEWNAGMGDNMVKTEPQMDFDDLFGEEEKPSVAPSVSESNSDGGGVPLHGRRRKPIIVRKASERRPEESSDEPMEENEVLEVRNMKMEDEIPLADLDIANVKSELSSEIPSVVKREAAEVKAEATEATEATEAMEATEPQFDSRMGESSVVLLKRLFDAADIDATDAELCDLLAEELSQRREPIFPQAMRVYWAEKGRVCDVYLVFPTSLDALIGQRSLDGDILFGKPVEAELYDEKKYLGGFFRE